MTRLMNNQIPDTETNRELKELERSKRALVLSGGGARGAYEIGVLKALHERSIGFDLMFGTSVGGINAAFFAQGKFARLEDLWSNLKPTDVFRFPTMHQLRNVIAGHQLGFLGGLLDTTPLEEMLHREMDVDLFKNSATKVGFVTTDLCTLETRLIMSDDITSRRHLVDTMMASAALPILFPARNLNGEGFWIDGGMVRNTPMQAAINLGAKDIYIVLLQAENDGSCPTNIMQVLSRCADILLYASARDGIRLVNEYNKVVDAQQSQPQPSPQSLTLPEQRISLKVFQPKNQVNLTVLDINPQRSRGLIKQGYEEALAMLDSEELFQAS